MAADSPATPALPPPVFCEHCGYDLAGIKVVPNPVTCPECGKTAVGIPKLRANGFEWRLAVLPLVIFCLAAPWTVFVLGFLVHVLVPAVPVAFIAGPLAAGVKLRARLSGSDRRDATTVRFVVLALATNIVVLMAARVVARLIGMFCLSLQQS